MRAIQPLNTGRLSLHHTGMSTTRSRLNLRCSTTPGWLERCLVVVTHCHVYDPANVLDLRLHGFLHFLKQRNRDLLNLETAPTIVLFFIFFVKPTVLLLKMAVEETKSPAATPLKRVGSFEVLPLPQQTATKTPQRLLKCCCRNN